MKKILIILCLLAVVITGMAQSLTIEQAQLLARDNYPLIKRYELISSTEQYTLSNISKGWLPQITVYGQATYQSDVVELPEALRNMMSQSAMNVKGITKDQYKVGIDISQTIYDGGNISAQKTTAKRQANVQKAQNDVDMYALRERVNNLFFSLLLVEERLALNNDMQTLLKSNEDKLSSLVKNGLATESDVDAMKAERLMAVQQQALLESQKKALHQMLTIFTGQEVTALVRPKAVVSMEQNSRPELQLFNRQLLLTEAQEASLNSRLLPRLSVFAQGYYGYPGFNMYEDMFSHKWSLNGIIGVRFTWNIGALYTNRNDKAKLNIQRRQIENSRQTFLFNNMLLSAQESETIKGYREMIASDERIIQLRQNVRKAMESRLSHGIIDVNNLVQEINRENQAEINKITHEIEMLQHIYLLNNINGK